jgi:hypothetical protein
MLIQRSAELNAPTTTAVFVSSVSVTVDFHLFSLMDVHVRTYMSSETCAARRMSTLSHRILSVGSRLPTWPVSCISTEPNTS